MGEMDSTVENSDSQIGNQVSKPGLISLVLDLYAILALIFQIVLLFPKRPGFIELLANFNSWLLVPSFFILIFTVLIKSRRSIILWSLLTIIFLAQFGELFLPSFKPAHQCVPDDCMHLKVMTCNLYTEFQPDRSSQIEVIRDSGADIIALQEVNPDSKALIESKLSDLYPYRVLIPSGHGGTGLLSRYPIEEYKVFRLTEGWLNHIRATLDISGEKITVISAHPMPPDLYGWLGYKPRGGDEIRKLVEMAESDCPTLLMGDFNISDQSIDYRTLKNSNLKDTFREVGFGFGATWPARTTTTDSFPPLIRIDYIWHTDEFIPVSCATGPRNVSDHLPLVAEFFFINRSYDN